MKINLKVTNFNKTHQTGGASIPSNLNLEERVKKIEKDLNMTIVELNKISKQVNLLTVMTHRTMGHLIKQKK